MELRAEDRLIGGIQIKAAAVQGKPEYAGCRKQASRGSFQAALQQDGKGVCGMTVIEWKKEKADRRVEEQRAPLYWMVYQELYYAITSGQAAPGEHLAENVLARRLRVSRTPIRAALAQLEKEGLVIRKHGRALVYESMDREMRELIETRLALECLAVREACGNASDMDVSLLREVNQEFAEALRAGNIQGSARADERFHEEIYRIADNRVLLRALHGLERPMYGYRVRTCRSSADVEEQIAEHEALIKALKSRAVSRAQKVVTVHLTGKHRGERREVKNVSDSCPESFSCVS